MKRLFLLLILSFIGYHSFSEQLDSTVYMHLARSGAYEFIDYARAQHLTVEVDTVAEVLFAKSKGVVYSKPLNNDTGNALYVLKLIISTTDKDNSKMMLRNTKEVPGKENSWMDNEFMYMKWDAENPETKAMWYKVLMYKIKK